MINLCVQVENPEELTIETVQDDIEIETEEGQRDVMAVRVALRRKAVDGSYGSCVNTRQGTSKFQSAS